MKRRKDDENDEMLEEMSDDEEEVFLDDDVVKDENMDDVEASVDDEEARRRVLERIAADGRENPERRIAWDPRLGTNDEELECDPRAYVMLHRLHVEWPCLSFDVVKDEFGGGRTVFPHQVTLACGTQAGDAGANRLSVLRVSQLGRMEVDDEDDDRDLEDDEAEGDDDVEASVSKCSVAHPGTVNRVACFEKEPGIVATWCEDACVRVWDLRDFSSRLVASQKESKLLKKRCVATLALEDEGYAIAWARDGRLASGDNSGRLNVWASPLTDNGKHQREPSSSWKTNDSIEDVAWSPTEETVLMSVGCDSAIRVFDTRSKAPMISVRDAHAGDINCVSWNAAVSYLVATAGDDGIVKVWDLRSFGGAKSSPTEPVGKFSWHQGKPIASCQWDPHDESALVVAAADNTVTVWDLSVEDDQPLPSTTTIPHDNGGGEDDFASSVPPQLLFIHQGLTDPKEVKHHPQIPRLLMTTASDGLSFFIPALEGKASDNRA